MVIDVYIIQMGKDENVILLDVINTKKETPMSKM